MKNQLRIALLCGGPSLERGISLNSARSVCDHLQSNTIKVSPVYFDHKKRAYAISRAQLYSNTPSDFDFKLRATAKPLTQSALLRLLKSVDLVFPAMHGPFGEDGGIQRFMEKNQIKFVGSSAEACALSFDKFDAGNFIKKLGFVSMPCLLLERGRANHKLQLRDFFKRHKITRAIVKPATGGSSIAVYSVANSDDALQKARDIFDSRVDKRVVVEPFCKGIEFTVIILQNRLREPVAILPTEIEIDYKDHQIFDYRRKYLATRQVTYHCPPRFSMQTIQQIQSQAEELFSALGMRDFARFDGWVLPDGKLWFSDFNPISGMEQNSFLFMQAARLGMSHTDLLHYILKSACRRYGLDYPSEPSPRRATESKKSEVNVLFGGNTAERQVSLMSGTNVWLKLRQSNKYTPKPYLLDTKGRVWNLPYAFALNHTVEEIVDMCKSAKPDEAKLKQLRHKVLEKLSLEDGEAREVWFNPKPISLQKFIANSKYVFIALHGGMGEDGKLQKMLERRGVRFNGSGSKASKLCMDKYLTGLALQGLERKGIYIPKKKISRLSQFKFFKTKDYREYWASTISELGTDSLIVKPVDDGCSAGVARLYSAADLKVYVTSALAGHACIPIGRLNQQNTVIEMPTSKMKNILLEKFIETDHVRVIGNELKWKHISDWIEITVGVLGEQSKMRALSPSLTVAIGNVLSLEEKFQGGTGVNITPPPPRYVSRKTLSKAKRRIEKIARVLDLGGYARVDAFMNIRTGEINLIEVNTLPGLTPSTVLYHQALAEKKPLYPTQFLEQIIELS